MLGTIFGCVATQPKSTSSNVLFFCIIVRRMRQKPELFNNVCCRMPVRYNNVCPRQRRRVHGNNTKVIARATFRKNA